MSWSEVKLLKDRLDAGTDNWTMADPTNGAYRAGANGELGIAPIGVL